MKRYSDNDIPRVIGAVTAIDIGWYKADEVAELADKGVEAINTFLNALPWEVSEGIMIQTNGLREYRNKLEQIVKEG